MKVNICKKPAAVQNMAAGFLRGGVYAAKYWSTASATALPYLNMA